MNFDLSHQETYFPGAMDCGAMPLMNSIYPVGKCREFIEAIPDENVRAIAWGEYFYYSGQAEMAVKTMEPYQNSSDSGLRYSANLVRFFASFTRGYIQEAMDTFEQIQTDMQNDLRRESSPSLLAIGAFAVTASSVLLHLPRAVDVDLKRYISFLPDGMKLWACYMLAHKMYLEKTIMVPWLLRSWRCPCIRKCIRWPQSMFIS